MTLRGALRKPPAPTSSKTDRVMLLLVDDDDAARLALRDHFEELGWKREPVSDDDLRQQGDGSGLVPRSICGLRCHLSHHLRSKIRELIIEFDCFASVTPTLVTRGASQPVSKATLRPRGAQRNIHGVRQCVDTGQQLGTVEG